MLLNEFEFDTSKNNVNTNANPSEDKEIKDATLRFAGKCMSVNIDDRNIDEIRKDKLRE